MTELEETARRLSFIGDAGAAYTIAAALDGADCPEAAIIHIESAWKRKERTLRAQLEAQRRKTNTTEHTYTDAGTEPPRMPTTRAEFERLSYMERLWMYHNAPAAYNSFVRRR